MAQLMVLAAGLGERLRPLTEECPKPLVPIGDAPALAHLLHAARSLPLTTPTLINAHWQADKLRQFAAHCSPPLQVLEETELLGTAGGIANARPWLKGAVLIWNADIYLTPDPALCELALKQAEPTLFVSPLPARRGPGQGLGNNAGAGVGSVAGIGSVGVAAGGRVVRLRSERAETPASGFELQAYDYVGLCVLPAGVLSELPARGCLVADFLIPWLKAGREIQSLVHPGPWFDVGTLETYLDVNLSWLKATGRANYVARGVTISPNVELVDTVVGEGALIQGSGRIERCVIWPGAQLTAPLASAVVTREHQVLVPREPAGRVGSGQGSA